MICELCRGKTFVYTAKIQQRLQKKGYVLIFPIPPEKQFRIVPLVRSIIHCASKYIQKTAINRLPDPNAMLPIKHFWISSSMHERNKYQDSKDQAKCFYQHREWCLVPEVLFLCSIYFDALVVSKLFLVYLSFYLNGRRRLQWPL